MRRGTLVWKTFYRVAISLKVGDLYWGILILDSGKINNYMKVNISTRVNNKTKFIMSHDSLVSPLAILSTGLLTHLRF